MIIQCDFTCALWQIPAKCPTCFKIFALKHHLYSLNKPHVKLNVTISYVKISGQLVFSISWGEFVVVYFCFRSISPNWLKDLIQNPSLVLVWCHIQHKQQHAVAVTATIKQTNNKKQQKTNVRSTSSSDVVGHACVSLLRLTTIRIKKIKLSHINMCVHHCSDNKCSANASKNCTAGTCSVHSDPEILDLKSYALLLCEHGCFASFWRQHTTRKVQPGLNWLVLISCVVCEKGACRVQLLNKISLSPGTYCWSLPSTQPVTLFYRFL